MKYVYILIFILFSSLSSFAQEEYYNDSLGFGFVVPQGWELSFQEDWPEEIRTDFRFMGSTDFLCNPENIELLKFPFIWIEAVQESVRDKEGFISEVYLLSRLDVDKMNLPGRSDRFVKVDTHYEKVNNHIALAMSVYRKSRTSRKTVIARAHFVGTDNYLVVRGFWTAETHEQVWAIYNDVIDSFKYNPEMSASISERIENEIEEMTPVKGISLIWKWAGIILTISIVVGIAKWMFGRAY